MSQVDKLGSSVRKNGASNMIIALFILLCTGMMGYVLRTNSQLISDNRSYIEDSKSHIEQLLEVNTKLSETNKTLVYDMAEKLNSIEGLMKIMSSNDIVVWREIIDKNGDKVISPIYIEK